MMNETIQTIFKRQSCRDYKDVQIPKEILDMILQAGLQAPSSMNRQQCFITALTNPILLEKLSKEITSVLNREENYSCFYNASTVILVTAPRDYSALFTDGSCILENIFLAASSLDIGSCWINQLHGIEDEPSIRNILDTIGIASNHHVCGCAILGYPKQVGPKKEKDAKRIHYVE